MSCQTLHVLIASDIKQTQSFDWPKWRCALWHYIISHFCWTNCQFRWSDNQVVDMSIVLPVLRRYSFAVTQLGNARPRKREMPNTTRFLDELRSTYWRLEVPTAASTPVANMHTSLQTELLPFSVTCSQHMNQSSNRVTSLLSYL